MIEIDAVTKIYGDTAVVDQVSLVIDPGTICTVVGTSGSGKTTDSRAIPAQRRSRAASPRVRITYKPASSRIAAVTTWMIGMTNSPRT
ncbi:MAG TPA: hypothetical protein VL133_03675, partial [Devosia sp.]|nr:hypothetical protein [Devosia sp.]